MTDDPDFEVHLEPPERLSMSFLRAAGSCLRRAHAERTLNAGGEDAIIGTIAHEVFAAVATETTLLGRERPGIAESVETARAIMRRPETAEPLSSFVWESVLELTELWARRAYFHPQEVFEQSWRTELNGRVHSARIDRFLLDAPHVQIIDYKTGRAGIPTKLPFQGESYAWHAFTRHPDVELVTYVEDWVRFEPGEPWEIERADLPRIEAMLHDRAERIYALYAEGITELPGKPGEACAQYGSCPVAVSCPIPEEVRPRSLVTTEEEAREELRAVFVEEARLVNRRERVRGYVDAAGVRAVELNGRELGYEREPRSTVDRKRMIADVRASGVAVPPEEHYTSRGNPQFGPRRAS